MTYITVLAAGPYHIAPIGSVPGPDHFDDQIRGEWKMRFLITALTAAAFLASANAAFADKRVAFVVGNGA